MAVFLNDNGGTAKHDNRLLRGFKGKCREGRIRVPFVMQWPAGIPKGQVIDEPVIVWDLVPRLTGKAETLSKRVLHWKNGSRWAVRDGDLKPVVGEENPGDLQELCDIPGDIGAKNNLASRHPDEVTRLNGLYEKWKAPHQPTPWVEKRKAARRKANRPGRKAKPRK